jgi:hypothetical protein
MNRIIIIFIICISLIGCATPGTNGTVNPNSETQKFVDGAKWVMFITDIMVPSMCIAKKLSVAICSGYSVASDQLKKDLLVIDELMAKGATKETIAVATAQAMTTYLMIEAAYKGQLS